MVFELRIISGPTDIQFRRDADTCKWRQEQRRLQEEGWQVPVGHLELGSEHMDFVRGKVATWQQQG